MTLKKSLWLTFIGAIITIGSVACRANTPTETAILIVDTPTPTLTTTPIPSSTPPKEATKIPLPTPPPEDPDRKPNHLINEKSPYLLQHAYNPVNWYPWGEEAFEKARQENKLIFLSIGYSTCHWCHVMEEESFSDAEVGQLINDTFVAIKVDREERPDIDNYYMNVSTMLTGSGGWPLNIFMTPDQKPFIASTYIPKESRFGRPGLMELIPRMELAWQLQDPDLLDAANQVANIMEQVANLSMAGEFAMDESLLEATYQQLADDFDAQNGGFGKAPKFATPNRLLFLLRYWQRTGDKTALAMVEQTLQAIRRGGVYDQVGYGAHRYATDAEWVVPHFEKMLYDQALLALAYIEAYQATGNSDYEQAAREIFTYVLRDMTAPSGGFYSAEDADSDGEEGKFYVWTVDEIRQVLDNDDAAFAIAVFNLSDTGNFIDPIEGKPVGTNILHLTQPLPDLARELQMPAEEFAAQLESIRTQLYAARQARPHPLKDDKILTDWNGLMIAALAKGGQVLGEPVYSAAAQQAADFILAHMRDENGRLYHRYRDGEAALPGNVDDYAFFTWGLLELYETTFEVRYLEAALALTDELLNHFWDENTGGLFFTPDDGEGYLARQKQIFDLAIPSGNSVTMLNLLRLGRMTANTAYEEKAVAIGKAFSQQIQQEPSAHSQLMIAVDFGVGPSYEVVIVGEPGAADTEAMLAALRKEFVPNKVVLFRPPTESPEIVRLAEFTKYQMNLNDQATAYVCLNYYCELPTNDIDKMMALLGAK